MVESLRGPYVGTDTRSYLNGFIMINRGIVSNKWELLFRKLNSLIGLFTENPQWILVASSGIVLIGFGYFIINNTEEGKTAFLSVFLFITLLHYFNSMNLIRQYCAMAFAINIYTVLSKDKSKKALIKAIILLLISTQFHSISIVCIGYFIPFLFSKINRKTIILIVLASIATIVLFWKLLSLIVLLLPQYSVYIGGKYFENTEIGAFYMSLILLKLLLISVVFLFNPEYGKNRQLYTLALLVMISIGIILLKSKVTLAVRLSYFFDIFVILLVPGILQRLRSKQTLILSYAAVILFGIIIYYYIMRGSARGCVPYYFYWNSI